MRDELQFLMFKDVIFLINVRKWDSRFDSPSSIRNSSLKAREGFAAISAKFLNLNYLRQECLRQVTNGMQFIAVAYVKHR